jgi:hypothetical protein
MNVKKHINTFSNYKWLSLIIIVGCCIIYDWAYFFRLGLKFHDVPTSISEYARTILEWVPLIGLIFIIILIELMIIDLEENHSYKELSVKLQKYKLSTVYKFYNSILGYVLILPLIIWLLGVKTIVITDPIFISIATACSIYLVLKKITSKLKHQIDNSLILTCCVIFFFSILGYISATEDLRVAQSDNLVNLLLLKDDKHMFCIRNLEKGFLAWDDSKQSIAFVPWYNISTVEYRLR